MIDFIVSDLTHLRYFAPFSASMGRLGYRFRWLLDLENTKYNAIGNSSERVNLVVRLARETGAAEAAVLNRTEQGECAITVETASPRDRVSERYDAIVSMQHGFDYTLDQRAAGPKVQYIMWDKVYVDHHRQLKSIGSYSVPTVPVPFWMSRDLCRTFSGPGRIATIFYPEEGLHGLVNSACSLLEKHQIQPVLKQRRKNQAVPETLGRKAVYDDLWHPSESIFYPAVSDLCVGFGTSAYCDAVPAGIVFVDCAEPTYSRHYVKPRNDNFISCLSDDLEQSIIRALSMTSQKFEMDVESQDNFTQSVMEKSNVSRS